jgi:iron-sulfur cluster repair protein YtfE (RIC family)
MDISPTPPAPSVSRSSLQPLGGDKGDLPPSSNSPHPRRSSSSAEIIQHLAAVHHRSLGEHLHELDVLFQHVEPPLGAAQTHFRKIKHLFAGLKEELCECMVHEKRVVFPQIERWEAGGRPPSSSPSDALLKAARDLAQWHSRLVVQFWKLTRRVRDLDQWPAEARLLRELQSALSECCDDFDQQLFETDCLLLPRITSWNAQSTQPERQLCPP